LGTHASALEHPIVEHGGVVGGRRQSREDLGRALLDQILDRHDVRSTLVERSQLAGQPLRESFSGSRISVADGVEQGAIHGDDSVQESPDYHLAKRATWFAASGVRSRGTWRVPTTLATTMTSVAPPAPSDPATGPSSVGKCSTRPWCENFVLIRACRS